MAATATNTVGPVSPEPKLGLLGSDTFDTQPLMGWNNGPGWAFVPHDSGLGLQIFNSNQPIVWVHADLYNIVAQASFQNTNGDAQVSVRVSGAGSYTLSLNAVGQVSLLRAGQLFSSATVAPTGAGQWRSLRLSAIGGMLRASIDGTEVIALEDIAPLPPGAITLGGWFSSISDQAELPQNTVQVDDFAVYIPVEELPLSTATPSPIAPTDTATNPPTFTPTAPPSATATFTPSPPPPQPSITPTRYPTLTPSKTPSPTPTKTATPTKTPTPTPTSTATPIGYLSPTPSFTPSYTPTLWLDRTFTVNTTGDTNDGTCDITHCSLREAILAANLNPIPDRIVFSIGSGAQTITLASALPDITNPVIIDGSTQPGYSGKPLIELNGNNLPNVSGLRLLGGNSTVRSLVINRFGQDGIQIVGPAYGSIIENNNIGTDVTGNQARPNGRYGIYVINSSSNRIGGMTANWGNLISGNTENGITIEQDSSNGGSLPANSDLIINNTISKNGAAGVLLQGYLAPYTITQNVIYGNVGLGIDLSPVGVKPNDSVDADDGPNTLVNFPVISMVAVSATDETITGTLSTQPGQNRYHLEFFASSACDASGYGEGETYLGAVDVMTDASGNASFNAIVNLAGYSKYVTATTTDSAGNTSEFSACFLPLNPPTGLQAKVTSPTAIALTWADSTIGETEYRLERSTDSGTTWTQIAALAANSTAYTDSTILCQLPYLYRLRAYRAPGDYSMYSPSVSISSLCNLNAPTNLAASAVDATQLTLNWTDNATNETLYSVERSSDKGANWTEIATALAVNSSSYLSAGLTCETTYQFRVRAGTSNGQRSSYSNTIEISTRLCVPTGLTAARVDASTVSLSWVDKSASETGYIITRDDSPTPIASLPANTTSYTDTNTGCGVTYTYTVQAVRSTDGLTSPSTYGVLVTMPLCAPADLSLSMASPGSNLPETGQVTYTLTVSNSGPNAAKGIRVRLMLPTSLTYSAYTGSQGSYDSKFTTWWVGDLMANASATLTVTAPIPVGRYGQTITTNAEVSAAGAQDPDSTPNNASTAEDDWASASFTVGCAPASVMNVPAGDVQALQNALTAAANETCFPGVDTITLPAGSTYSLTKAGYTDATTYGSSGFNVNGSVILEGNGARIERNSSATTGFRLMQLGGNNTLITLNNLVLTNGSSTLGSNATYGYHGGALIVLPASTITLNNVQIVNNYASYGAGIYNRGTLTINNSLFDGNTEAVQNTGILTVSNSTFINQRSRGIYQNSSGPALLQFNTFVGNSSALWSQAGTMLLIGNLFARNTNAICGLNTSNLSAHIVSNGYNLSEDNGCVGFLTQPSDRNNLNLKLGQITDNGGPYLTAAPMNGSPAIDAVPAASCPLATDGRGAVRPVDGNGDETADCDSGAIETVRTGLALTQTADHTSGFPGDPLTITLTLSNAGPQPATGIIITDKLPLGITADSITPSQGSYNSATGIWMVGNLNANQRATLTISGSMNNTAVLVPLTNTASLTTASTVSDVPDTTISVTVTCSPQSGVSFSVPAGDSIRLLDAVSGANNEACYPGPNTITLAGGTYILTDPFPGTESDPSAFPVIASTITIEGNNALIERNWVAGTKAFRLFTVTANNSLTMNKVRLYYGRGRGGNVYNLGTFTATDSQFYNGWSDDKGGSIYNAGTLLLTRASISNNSAMEGGAIYNTGSMTLIDANPYGNNRTNYYTVNGGVIYNAGTAVLQGGVFSGNMSGTYGSGGSIYNEGIMTISRALFSGDSADYGGSIFQAGGSLSISDTTFYAGHASFGGFIYLGLNGEISINRSLFSSGYASNNGSTIFSQATLHVTNSTFSNNTPGYVNSYVLYAPQGSADIRYSTFAYNNIATSNGVLSGNIALTASIFGGNAGRNCSGNILSGGYNIADDATCNLSGPGDLNNTNPLLAHITDNGGPTTTHALYNGSPAINHVPADECGVTTDQRGIARPQGGGCDSGAFEGGVPNANGPYPTITRLDTYESSGDGWITDGEAVDGNITYLKVYYDHPMSNGYVSPRAANDVTNTANYMLVSPGVNRTFETSTCSAAPQGDDQSVRLYNWPSYNASTNAASVRFAATTPLPAENYRLLVCNVEDVKGIPLDGNGDGFGGDPYIINFTTDPAQFKADLVVTQTDTPDPVQPGGTLSYTVKVSNAGPNRAFNVTLTDKLPDGVTYGSAVGATCTESNQIVTCSLGTLLNSASTTVTLNVTIAPTIFGTLTNTISVTSTTTDLITANNTDIRETTTSHEPPAVDLVVNVAADTSDGVCGALNCTLREAIDAANAHPGMDTIRFNLPAPYTISLLSALPAIQGDTVLDGSSQPGYDGIPLVVLEGDKAGARVSGLSLAGDHTIVRGLVITGFSGNGIVSTGGISTISRNTISGNSGLGIDLLANGVTPNDASDADGLQNTPELTAVTRQESQITVRGRVNTTPNAALRVEFFSNAVCGLNGFGEGQTFLGSIDGTTDSAGNWNFTTLLAPSVPAGQFITATATNAQGQTSEFSACLGEVMPPTGLQALVKSPVSVELDWIYTGPSPIRFTVERSDAAHEWTEVARTAVLSYTDTALTCDMAYDYRVRAWNDDVPSLYSPMVHISTARCPDFDLTPAVVVSPSPVTAGASLTYQIDVSNIGPDDALNAQITMTLPAGMSFLASRPVACSTSSALITCPINSVHRNGKASLELDIQLADTLRGKVSNTVHAVARGLDVNASNDDAVVNFPIVIPLTPTAPVLYGPASGVITHDITPDLSWKPVTYGYRYQVQLSSNISFTDLKADVLVNGLAYSVTPALPEGLYYWRVRAINSLHVAGVWSAVWKMTMDTTPPAAVPNLSKPADQSIMTTDKFNFVWLAVPGAAGYRLELGMDKGFVNRILLPTDETTATTLPVQLSVGPGTYYWHVQARDVANNWGGWSATYTFSINNLLTPANGANLVAPATGLRPTFTWMRLSNALGYKVLVARDPAFKDMVYTSDLLAATSTTHTVPQPLTYGTYYARVLVQGKASWTIVHNHFVITPALPAAPVLLAPANNGLTDDSTPTLSWKPVTYAPSALTYEVQLDTTSTFGNPKFIVTGLNAASADVTRILADGRYYWRVRAVNQWGGTGSWSAPLSFSVDTAPPATPKLSKPLNNSSTTLKRPTFIWLASTGANGYEIELTRNGTATTVPIASTSYTPSANLAAGVYTWRVRAKDMAGNWSDWSGSFTLTIQ
jgi:CSLREA domain-containing protein/uncharacterized repeat protein (TIGR01451 family)